MEIKLKDSPYITINKRNKNKKGVQNGNQRLSMRECLSSIGKEYCKESSICGLKNLVDEKTTSVERFIWVCTLMVVVMCSIVLVWITFQKYFTSPLVTTQMPEGISVSSIIFPAIGICTTNRISKRAVTELADDLMKQERNQIYSLPEMLKLLKGLGQLYDLQPMDDNIANSTRVHEALGIYDVNNLLRSLTPSCEDIMLRCAWNERPYNCTDLFDFRLTTNGYCCTFNYLRQSDEFEDRNSDSRNMDMYNYGNKSYFDFDQGLKVLLRLNESDDFYYNVPLEGAQLQFSDAYDFPDAPSGSFALQIISQNVHMTVSVTASFTEASRDIQHISQNIRRCLFYDESPYLPFYTHSDCMLKCRMLFLQDNCNCTPFNMPRLKDARRCDMRDVPCLRIYNAQSLTVRPDDLDPLPDELELDLVDGGIFCPMCLPTCSKTAYSYDFNNVNINTDNLNMDRLAPSDEDEDWLEGANFTATSIVHVKYAREVADSYGQNVIMKWFDLISNIGSTCGFVTGFSFVSVLEFIYFFTVKLIRKRYGRREEQYHCSGKKTVTFGHLQPVDRNQPIYWRELLITAKPIKPFN